MVDDFIVGFIVVWIYVCLEFFVGCCDVVLFWCECVIELVCVEECVVEMFGVEVFL